MGAPEGRVATGRSEPPPPPNPKLHFHLYRNSNSFTTPLSPPNPPRFSHSLSLSLSPSKARSQLAKWHATASSAGCAEAPPQPFSLSIYPTTTFPISHVIVSPTPTPTSFHPPPPSPARDLSSPNQSCLHTRTGNSLSWSPHPKTDPRKESLQQSKLHTSEPATPLSPPLPKFHFLFQFKPMNKANRKRAQESRWKKTKPKTKQYIAIYGGTLTPIFNTGRPFIRAHMLTSHPSHHPTSLSDTRTLSQRTFRSCAVTLDAVAPVYLRAASTPRGSLRSKPNQLDSPKKANKQPLSLCTLIR